MTILVLAIGCNEATGLHIIPVIDVLGGVAVAARLGDRENYQPLTTPLAESSDPVAIARGYMQLYPFQTIYIADLDAIEGRATNHDAIDRLIAQFPDVKFWIDSGLATQSAAAKHFDQKQICVVVGSESVKSIDAADSLFQIAPHHTVLSLDLDQDGFIGPFELLTSPQMWPRSVIAMSISNVGSGNGPAMEYVNDVCKLAGEHRHVYAAGGIRSIKDCQEVHQAGANGVLIATALHAQNIKADDLTKIAGL